MCGRFTGAGANRGKDFRPGDSYTVATATGETNMRWGFRFDRRLTVNARAETAPIRFGSAFASGRCAITVSGFYEWSPEKEMFYYTASDGDIVLCALSRKEEPPKPSKTSEQLNFLDVFGLDARSEAVENRFVVITTAANESVSPVHDRMPLMVERRHVDDWLYDENYARRLLTAQMPTLNQLRM